MLAELRHPQNGARRLVREPDRDAEMLDAVFIDEQHAALGGGRVDDRVLERAHRRVRHVDTLEPGGPFLQRLRSEALAQVVLHRILHPRRLMAGREIRSPGLVEEVLGELVLDAAERDVAAILGVVHVVERRAAPVALVLHHVRAMLGEHRALHVRASTRAASRASRCRGSRPARSRAASGAP